MAQKTATKKVAEVSAAQRKTALAVVRGLRLATHSAATLVKDIDVEAMRLLRITEGLVIAVAGRLEALGRSSSSLGADQAAKSEGNKANKQEKDTVAEEVVRPCSAKPLHGTEKTGGKKKKKKKAKGKADVVMESGASAVLTAKGADPSATGASSCITSDKDLDDEWADLLPVVHGPENLPVATSSSSDCRSSVKRASSPGGPRRLAPRISDEIPAVAISSSTPLLAGHAAACAGLGSRPDLEGEMVLLLEYDFSSGRWACRTKAKEKLRIKSVNLRGINPNFQKLALQKFDAV